MYLTEQQKATFPYHGNGYTNCAEISFMIRGQLAIHFVKHATSGVHLHAPYASAHSFSYLGNRGGIVFKCGLLLDPLTTRFIQGIGIAYLDNDSAHYLLVRLLAFTLYRPSSV